MPCGVQKYQAGITTKCVINNKPSDSLQTR